MDGKPGYLIRKYVRYKPLELMHNFQQRDRLVIDGVEVTRDMMVAGSEALGVLRLEGWVVDDLRASAEIYAAMRRAKNLPQTKPGRP